MRNHKLTSYHVVGMNIATALAFPVKTCIRKATGRKPDQIKTALAAGGISNPVNCWPSTCRSPGW